MTKQPAADADRALDRLPHGPTFRFISRVIDLTPGRAGAAVWDVTGDEPYFSGHFPGNPVLPGVLLAEALAQLAGLVGFADAGPLAASVRLAHVDVKFPAAARPPASIMLGATLSRELGALRLFDVEARSDGVTIAKGTLTLAATSPSNGAP